MPTRRKPMLLKDELASLRDLPLTGKMLTVASELTALSQALPFGLPRQKPLNFVIKTTELWEPHPIGQTTLAAFPQILKYYGIQKHAH